MFVKVLGPFNSGTHLTERFFNKELRNKKIGTRKKLIWTHSLNDSKLCNMIDTNKNVLFIVMYRPLDSWVESMKTTNYSLIWDNNISSSCMLNIDQTPKNKFNIKLLSKYNSIIDLYDTYYETYVNLMNTYPNIIFLEYSKVIDKTISYDYVKEKIAPFSIPFKDKEVYFNILNTKSKSHGHCVKSSDEALKKYNTLKMSNEYNKYFNPLIQKYFEGI